MNPNLPNHNEKIIPPARDFNAEADPESLEEWGFADTRFCINDRGYVQLTGKRYALCDEELPSLLPWIESVMGIHIEPKHVHASQYPTKIPEPVVNAGFLTDAHTVFATDQIVQDNVTRLRHGHGHTQHEMYAIKYTELGRIPDVVIYPSTENQVEKLVELAIEYDVCLVPFGGGTSVTEALRCPEQETRMIVSVDMRRLNRILWIDPVNRMACIQAGAVGRHIMSQLAEYGFTMGHEPDSIEFSTLGGWIATHASGMKKNKYGNIEDLILDFNVVTTQGKISHTTLPPRASIGSDPRQCFFGSEGNLGIITQAVVKLFPLPQVQRYGSIVFPTFEDGVGFMYELSASGAVPASVRLVDNLQFQFSQALKPKKKGLKILKSKLEKFFVTKIKKMSPQNMVACTLVFEGSAEEVQRQENITYNIAKKFSGMKGGSENGERGYQLTFGIAYIRDFVMKHYILGESFETSVPWSQALELCENVKKRVSKECEKHGLPGKPFLTCRVTQIYNTGVCIYFYFGFCYQGVANPDRVYEQIEMAAREEILKSGGSLSHHHGVGKIRQNFLKNICSEAVLNWNQQTKKALDPQNIFGSANQLITEKLDGSVGRSPTLIASLRAP